MGHEAATRRNIAAALANNLNLQDRFGRPILEGGGYTANFPQPPVFVAEKITIALDRPDLPPGTCRVELVSRITLLLLSGAPTTELALCAMPKVRVDEVAPPADPPPGDAPSGAPVASGESLIQLTDSLDSLDSSALLKETADAP